MTKRWRLSTVTVVEPHINLNNAQPIEQSATTVKDIFTLQSNVSLKEPKGTCTDCAIILSL